MRLKSDWSKVNSLKLAKRVLAYFKQFKIRILLSLVALGVVAAMSGAAAFLVKPALDDIFINQDKRALLIIPILLGHCFRPERHFSVHSGIPDDLLRDQGPGPAQGRTLSEDDRPAPEIL
jgi:hypothetical protein